MSDEGEKRFLDEVGRQLDRHADGVDELTAARLRAIRRSALEQRTARRFNWFPAAGLATAAAALLAVLLLMRGPGDAQLSSDDWELLASGAELELIEELEFYAWLDETQADS